MKIGIDIDDVITNTSEVLMRYVVEHCESVQQVGIKSFLFITDVNKNISTDSERVDSWPTLASKLAELAN